MQPAQQPARHVPHQPIELAAEAVLFVQYQRVADCMCTQACHIHSVDGYRLVLLWKRFDAVVKAWLEHTKGILHAHAKVEVMPAIMHDNLLMHSETLIVKVSQVISQS
jgi:hypothetical protein